MCCIICRLLGCICWLQIHDDRFLRIAHNHPLRGRITWIHLLVGHKGRYVDEITWLNTFFKFQGIAPANFSAPRYYVNHRLEFTMMMLATGDMRCYDRYTRPDPLRSDQFA